MVRTSFVLLLLLATGAWASDDWGAGAEELTGAKLLETEGIKVILNNNLPKLTAVATGAVCDGVDSSACLGQYLLTTIKSVYEVDPTGSEVDNRATADVLDLAAAAWTVSSEDLSADTEPALNAVPAAVFRAPFQAADAIPACAPAATFTTSASQPVFEFKVWLFPAATNYTSASSGETIELLRGNVKTLLTVEGWPFCSADNVLVVELGLKSKALGDRVPTVINGTQAAEALAALEEQLGTAVGAVLEGDDDGMETAPSERRRLMGPPNGNGNGAGNGGGNGAGSAAINSSLNGTSGSGKGNGERRIKRWEAVQAVAERAAARLNSTLSKALADKVGARRAIAGLGRRADDRRLFLALPGSAALDAKLDVPTVALIDGVANTTISVTAPSFNQGQGVQRLRLAFPAFSTLEYDPTCSFAATDASLDSDLTSLLASSGAPPARSAAAALALTLAAVAALMV